VFLCLSLVVLWFKYSLILLITNTLYNFFLSFVYFGRNCLGLFTTGGRLPPVSVSLKTQKGGREGSGADRREGGKGRNNGKGTEAERSAA
jgi:hypothetical protein